MTSEKKLLLALSSAFSCFNNDAIGSIHNGTHTVGCIASGMNAIAYRLEEIAKEFSDTPIRTSGQEAAVRLYELGLERDRYKGDVAHALTTIRNLREQLDRTQAELDTAKGMVEGSL